MINSKNFISLLGMTDYLLPKMTKASTQFQRLSPLRRFLFMHGRNGSYEMTFIHSPIIFQWPQFPWASSSWLHQKTCVSQSLPWWRQFHKCFMAVIFDVPRFCNVSFLPLVEILPPFLIWIGHFDCRPLLLSINEMFTQVASYVDMFQILFIYLSPLPQGFLTKTRIPWYSTWNEKECWPPGLILLRPRGFRGFRV